MDGLKAGEMNVGWLCGWVEMFFEYRILNGCILSLYNFTNETLLFGSRRQRLEKVHLPMSDLPSIEKSQWIMICV